ncbi:MAG TPA: galactokinase [Candidatus Limnocylindrales bacterium]
MDLTAPNLARIENLVAALDSAWGAVGDQVETRIVRAPGVVSLMGDHTELSEGFVLPAAIELDTWIAFRPRRDGFVRVKSLDFGEVGSFRIDALEPDLGRSAAGGAHGLHGVHGVRVAGRSAAATATAHFGAQTGPTGLWSDYVGGAAWSLREAALPVRGFEGVVDTTIPIGIGLASSAALGVASALALLGGGHVLSGPAMASIAQRAERDFVGVDSGIVDQMASAAGRETKAMVLDCRTLETRHVPLPYGVQVVVCDTGERAEGRSRELMGRRADCARVVALLAERLPGLCSLRDLDMASLRRHGALLPEGTARRAEHVVAENARVVATAAALEAGDLAELGRLFAESHASLRDLYEVSTPALDAMVDVARAVPGVVAARMTGMGFGGCTVNLVLTDAVPALQAAVAREYVRRTGLKPHIYPVALANGAGPLVRA